jgi:integrase/recombinase XerD
MASKTISPASERMYSVWVGIFTKWLDGRKPTPKVAAKFLDSLHDQYRQNSIAAARNALVWKFGFKLQSISIEIGEPKYISVEQVRELIDTTPSLLLKTILSLMFSTACRISEILNLRKEDVEWDKGIITVTRKGGYRQRVAVEERGMEMLKEWMRERTAKGMSRVFMDYDYNSIYSKLRKLSKNVGFKVTAHVMRHSRVVHLIEAGVPIERVSDIAGHRRLETTLQIYGRLRSEDLKQYLAPW